MRAGWWAALGLLSAAFACTGSNPRDKYYGTDAGVDFHAPISSVGGSTGAGGGTGGTATADTGGAAGSSAGGMAGSGIGGAAGSSAGGMAGSDAGAAGGMTGAAGGNGGTAGQAGGNGGAAGATALGEALPGGAALAGLTFAATTSRKDWTAAPRATKMQLSQVSSTWPWRWTTVTDTRGCGPSGLRPQPMES